MNNPTALKLGKDYKGTYSDGFLSADMLKVKIKDGKEETIRLSTLDLSYVSDIKNPTDRWAPHNFVKEWCAGQELTMRVDTIVDRPQGHVFCTVTRPDGAQLNGDLAAFMHERGMSANKPRN